MKASTLNHQSADPRGLVSPPSPGDAPGTADRQRRSVLQTTQHLLARMNLALQIRAERRQLARLSSAQLSDIGITEAQRDQELRRGAWHIPANRLRRNRAVR